MTEALPSFERHPASPALEDTGSGIALQIESDPARGPVARGTYRVLEPDRVRLGATAVRGQVALVAIHREGRIPLLGRPGAEAVVLYEEEPAAGTLEGWFNVGLMECCAIPEDLAGLYDVTAVLGPWKSEVVEVRVS